MSCSKLPIALPSSLTSLIFGFQLLLKIEKINLQEFEVEVFHFFHLCDGLCQWSNIADLSAAGIHFQFLDFGEPLQGVPDWCHGIYIRVTNEK